MFFFSKCDGWLLKGGEVRKVKEEKERKKERGKNGKKKRNEKLKKIQSLIKPPVYLKGSFLGDALRVGALDVVDVEPFFVL